jgi:PncC family amidohydrolase
MVTLTSADIMALLKKNGLEPDKVEFEVVERLREKNLKVATAESCTGGLISERITRVSGASEVFDCGVCSYANEIKEKLLGVRHDTLSILGAVSAETAIQMAEGVKKLSGADITVSVTGIAGPSGGTSEKPVGLVYIGIKSKENDGKSHRFIFDGTRDEVRLKTVKKSIELVIEEIENIR